MSKKNIAYKYKVSIIMAVGGSNCNCNNQGGGAKKLSEYNKFMKKEIKNVKQSNPKLSHRDAFSKAASNWSKMKK